MRNKLLLAIIMMLSVSSTLMAQHILYLKRGANLKGELVGSRRDTVYFRFMGNRLALPISQVNAVYFDELVAPQKIADPYGDRDAKITGYVTDSYLRAETESPDEGAQVYIVKEGDIKGFDYKLVTDTFSLANNVRDIYQQYSSANVDIPDEIRATMILYNVDTDQKFEEICRRTNKNVSMIKNSKKTMKTTCDENGKFQMPIASGTYYVLIVSKNTTSDTVAEAGGKIVCKKVSIQEGEDYVMSPVKIEVP